MPAQQALRAMGTPHDSVGDSMGVIHSLRLCPTHTLPACWPWHKACNGLVTHIPLELSSPAWVGVTPPQGHSTGVSSALAMPAIPELCNGSAPLGPLVLQSGISVGGGGAAGWEVHAGLLLSPWSV